MICRHGNGPVRLVGQIRANPDAGARAAHHTVSMTYRTLLSIGVAAAVLAGCGAPAARPSAPDAQPSPDALVVAVRATEFGFEPSTVRIPAGKISAPQYGIALGRTSSVDETLGGIMAGAVDCGVLVYDETVILFRCGGTERA